MIQKMTSGRILRSIGLLLLAAGVGFVGLTGWALEAGGVAILETEMADGTMRQTHVWYAEPDGELWVEAGAPENGWYVDVQERPTLLLSVPGNSEHAMAGAYLAQPIVGGEAHDQIRSLLREKYGFRDWWIGVVFDTTRSIAVRLVEPIPKTSQPAIPELPAS